MRIYAYVRCAIVLHNEQGSSCPFSRPTSQSAPCTPLLRSRKSPPPCTGGIICPFVPTSCTTPHFVRKPLPALRALCSPLRPPPQGARAPPFVLRPSSFPPLCASALCPSSSAPPFAPPFAPTLVRTPTCTLVHLSAHIELRPSPNVYMLAQNETLIVYKDPTS